MTTRPVPLSAATRRTILLLTFTTFTSMVSQRICDAMLPELARVFAVSLAQASQVVSMFAITYGVSQLFYGPLGDRLGKFRIITFGTLGCCAASLVAVFAPSLDVLLLARILMALGAAAMIPMAMAWIGDAVPPDQLQETLTRTGLGTTLGIVSGQLVGGLLTDAMGWRAPFVFMTVLSGVVGCLLYADLRRQRAIPATPGLHHQPMPRHGFIKQAVLIITGPWSRVILAIAVVEGAAGFGVLAMWASHLHRSLDLSLSLAGAIVALYGLGGMLYMAIGRMLIRRFGQPQLVLYGGFIVAVGALGVAFAPHWLLAVPASLFAGFGFFMFHNTIQTNAAQMTPHARGTAVALFSSFMFLGQSVGVVLAAGLVDRIGTGAVVALGGAVMALVGVIFSWALRRKGVRKTRLATPR